MSEPHARLHVALLLLVCLGGWSCGLTRLEWCIIVLAAALVLAAEAGNTAIERLSDRVSSEHHPLIGAAKDVAAGGVLLTALAAGIVGLLVFGPHLLDWLID